MGRDDAPRGGVEPRGDTWIFRGRVAAPPWSGTRIFRAVGRNADIPSPAGCRVKGKQGRPRNLYERVATLFRRGGVRRRHYATTSAAEFFAELSTAFLCDDNKWEPFTRAQLASRDLKTCAFLECVWSEPGGLECCCMGRVCPGLAL